MYAVLHSVNVVLSSVPLAALVAALVIAIVHWRRNGTVARLAVAGLSCQLLGQAGGIALAVVGSRIESAYGDHLVLVALVTGTPTLLIITGWTLLLAALFVGYRHSVPAPTGGAHR